MPALDLLLGTRRLRRDIETQSQQLGRDIERVRFTTAQLHHTLVVRATSPLGLASAVAAGFTVGKLSARPSNPRRIGRRAVASIAALTLSTARSIGMQVALPMAFEWVQTKFAKRKGEEAAAADAQTPSDGAPRN